MKTEEFSGRKIRTGVERAGNYRNSTGAQTVCRRHCESGRVQPLAIVRGVVDVKIDTVNDVCTPRRTLVADV